ncbi:hypothetical protein PIB30_080476 [Stylosanthes scabra]|uniref:Uncharacterized protein n=1 Tax=Stylosanthes scabra TaxID=79078 RepID=A0ABU6ZQ14_9FABA|nr:hypothetical protein [Stylosanthes scabra]
MGGLLYAPYAQPLRNGCVRTTWVRMHKGVFTTTLREYGCVYIKELDAETYEPTAVNQSSALRLKPNLQAHYRLNLFQTPRGASMQFM